MVYKIKRKYPDGSREWWTGFIWDPSEACALKFTGNRAEDQVDKERDRAELISVEIEGSEILVVGQSRSGS